MKIKVNRAFYIGGVTQPVGTVLEVDKPLGVELVALGKAVEVSEKVAEVSEGDPRPKRSGKKGVLNESV